MLNLEPTPTGICHWRLNDSLRKELKKHITDYFCTKEGSVSSQSALREAHKAVIRGHCIAMGSRLKKDSIQQTNNVNLQLKSLEERMAINPTRHILRQILEDRSKLKTLALGNTEKLLLYSRQMYYESTYSSDSDVERGYCPEDSVLVTGSITHDPVGVAGIFESFFSRLYSLPDTLPSSN